MTAMTLGARPAHGEVVRGRAEEQKIVGDLLRRAQRGAGSVLLVDGEPGIGKSLLLRASADQAAEQGFSLAVGAADQMSQGFGGFALRGGQRDPFAEYPGPGPVDSTTWWVTRIRARLERLAAAAPVLVCLDDLHWASLETLAVLRELPRDLKGQPVAWLLSRSTTLLSRSTTPHRGADYMFGLLEKDGATRVRLAPLKQDAVAAMLTDAFGAPPDQALADLACGAAGNPALVAELVGGLLDDHAVRVHGGRAMLASARLPQRIASLTQRWLDDLSERARHLVMMAAVLGLEFRLEDAAQMLGQTPATLLPAIEEAMDEAIMTAADYVFAFRHPLVRRAVSEMIPSPARQALHRQYGEMLLARGEPAALAAGHLLQAAHPRDPASLAGLDTAAAQTLGSAPQTAADLAVHVLELTSSADPAALPRAVATVEALTVAGRLDQAGQIARDLLATPQPPVAEDRLRCAFSSVLNAAGQPRQAADQARMVLARPKLAEGVRDRALTAHLQALAALRDDQAGQAADSILSAPGRHGGHAAAAAHLIRALAAWDRGQIGDGLDLLREAARHSEAACADARDVQPLLTLAAALVDLHQLDEATHILHAADHPAVRRIPAGAALLVLRARVHLAAGRLADAAAEGESALAAALALGAHGYAATVRGVLGKIELRRGDLTAASGHVACRRAADPQFTDIYARAEATMAQAQIVEACDGSAAVLGQLARIRADLTARPGLLLGDPSLAAWLTRAALAAGDGQLAASAAGAAQDLVEANPGFAAVAAAAVHSQGLVQQDPARLTEAVTLHCDPWASASAAEDLGVLYRARGDRDQAITYLKQALGTYGKVGADRDQARVRQRLRQLGIRRRHWATPPDRPVSGWDSLTETEQAVASLVADGLNNNQVAARMYISTHTVAHHLRQAFRKLSIASRVELARIVIQQAAEGPG